MLALAQRHRAAVDSVCMVEQTQLMEGEYQEPKFTEFVFLVGCDAQHRKSSAAGLSFEQGTGHKQTLPEHSLAVWLCLPAYCHCLVICCW
jgi:hypothetical protein